MAVASQWCGTAIGVYMPQALPAISKSKVIPSQRTAESSRNISTKHADDRALASPELSGLHSAKRCQTDWIFLGTISLLTQCPLRAPMNPLADGISHKVQPLKLTRRLFDTEGKG